MQELVKIPAPYRELLDQVFEIERKLSLIQEENSIGRNINKIKAVFEGLLSTDAEPDTGFTYHDPIGEDYNETRTDLEASIAGDSTENLVVTEVIKPILRYRKGNSSIIVRKGVVVVQSKQ